MNTNDYTETNPPALAGGTEVAINNIAIPENLQQIAQQLGRKLKMINLFCGFGGVSTAAHETGIIDEVLAIDNWDVAGKVLHHNFPAVDFWNTDISALGEHDILRRTLLQKGEADIGVVTAPCPPFSTAKGYIDCLDPLAWLFINGIEQLANTLPKCAFIENVPGMKDDRAIPIFNEIKHQIHEKLDPHYNVRCYKLDASYFRVPQTRTRLIWLLYRRDLGIIPTAPKPFFNGRELLRLGIVCPDILNVKVGQSKKTWKFNAIMNTITASEGGIEALRIDGARTKLYIPELLKLDTFPTWYTIPDGIKYDDVHRGLGNVVPVKLAQAILEHMIIELAGKF
jgi:site-specific DNA-cytosine methylase